MEELSIGDRIHYEGRPTIITNRVYGKGIVDVTFADSEGYDPETSKTRTVPIHPTNDIFTVDLLGAHDLVPVKSLKPYGTYAECDAKDIPVPVKLFDPCGSFTWYLYEYDPEYDVAFGFVVGPFPELGSVSMEELREYKGKLGLGIERDIHWQTRDLAWVMNKFGDRA